MKPQKFFLVSMIAIFGLAAANAQTAKEIIKKHIDAVGGKDIIQNIKSMRMESMTEVMGNEGPTTTVIVNGKGYKNTSDFGGQKVITCYTDKGGWSVNPMAGGAVEAMPDAQYKQGMNQIFIGGPLLDYQGKEYKAELLGKEKVDSVDAYKIKLTGKDSSEVTYFFDPSTWYVLKLTQLADMMGQQVEMTVKYSDFKKTELGYVLPFALNMNFGDQFTLDIKVQKVEFNPEIDPALFDQGNLN